MRKVCASAFIMWMAVTGYVIGQRGTGIPTSWILVSIDSFVVLLIMGVLTGVVLLLAAPHREFGETEVPDSTGGAYVLIGGTMVVASGLPFVVAFFGYFLPGFGITKKNILSEVPIRHPSARYGPDYDLRLQDTETSLLISVAAFIFMAMAVWLVSHGIKLLLKRRMQP